MTTHNFSDRLRGYRNEDDGYISTDQIDVANGVAGLDASKQVIADLPDDSVTYAKIQNVSATDKLLGRVTAAAGDVEEIACTAAGRALLDDADAAAQLVTLGLTATAAEVNTVCDGVLTGSAIVDVASIAADAGTSLDITVTGAALGDFAIFSAGVDLVDLIANCYVSAVDTVTVSLENQTAAAIDLASTTWKAKVFK